MSNEVKIAITSKADLDAIDRAIAKLKQLKNQTVKVKFDIDDDKLARKLKDLDKKVKEAGGIELDVDDRKAHKKLDGLIDKHKNLGKDNASIDLDTKKARDKLTYLSARLKTLADETVNVDLDTGAALGKIAALKAALKAIPDEVINIKADVDVNRASIRSALADALNGNDRQLIKTKLDVNKSHMRSALADALDFGDNRHKVKIDVDRDYLGRGISKAMGDVSGEVLSKKIKVELDENNLDKSFAGLLKKHTVNVKVDVDASELAALAAMISALDGSNINVRVRTSETGGTARAVKSIRSVGDAAADTAEDIDTLDKSSKKHISTANSMRGATSRLKNEIEGVGRSFASVDRDSNRVRNTFRALGRSSGGALRTMGAVGNVMTQGFALMTKGIPVIGGMVKGLNSLTTAAMTAGTDGAGALASFGKVAGPIGSVAVAAGLATVALGAVSAIGVAGTGALVAGMYATQAALGGIVGVSSVVGAAVGAAIAAPFVYFAAQTKEVQQAVDGMKQYVGDSMKQISSEAVGPALIGFTEKAKTAFDSVRPSIKRMAEATGQLVTQLSDKLPAVAQALAPALEKGLSAGAKHLNTMVDALPGISKGLGNLFDSLGSPEVMAASERFWNAVPGMITTAGKAIEGTAVAFTKVSDWMGSDQLAPMRDGLSAFAQEMGATDWSPAINGARDAMNAFGDFVGSIDGADLAGIAEGITGVFEGLTDIATDIDLTGLTNNLIQGIDGAVAGIGAAVKGVKIAIAPTFEIAGGGIQGLMDQLSNLGGAGGLGALENPLGPAAQIKILANVLWEIVDEPANSLKDKILALIDSLKGGGEEEKVEVPVDVELILKNSKTSEEARAKIAQKIRELEAAGKDAKVKITPSLVMTELLSPGTQILPPVNVDVKGNVTDIIMPNLGLKPVPLEGEIKPKIGPIGDLVGNALAGVTAPTLPIKGVLQSFDGAVIPDIPDVPVNVKPVIADLNLGALTGAAAPTMPIKGVLQSFDGAKIPDQTVPVKGSLESIITGSLGGANVPQVQVEGRLGEVQGTAKPVEVPMIPIFNAEGLRVGAIELPSTLLPPTNVPPAPGPVEIPSIIKPPAGISPTYTGPPVEIPSVLGPPLGINKPPKQQLPPITQPVVPKFDGIMGAVPNLPPAELPVHAKMDTSGVPTTLPPATQEVIQIKSGFNKEMATKLPPVTQEVIPQMRAMPTIPPLTVQVIPQFAGAAIPNLPPITVPVNFQVGPLNLPQPPAITVTVTSNASEVASQVASIPTSVTTSHSVNTNVSAAISQIQALNGMNTTSTHTVNVVVNGSVPGGGGPPGAPAAFAGIPQGISPMAGIAGFGAMSDTGLSGVAAAGGMTSDFRYSNGSGGSLLAISNIVRQSIVDGYSDLGSSIGDALVGGIESKESLLTHALDNMAGIINGGLVDIDFGGALGGLLDNLGIFDTLGNNIANKVVGSAGSTLARQAPAFSISLGDYFKDFKLLGFSLSDIFTNLFSGGVRAPRKVASGSLDGTGQMITYNNYQTIQNQFDGGLVGDPERQAKRVLDVLETVGMGRRANQVLGNNGSTTGGTA